MNAEKHNSAEPVISGRKLWFGFFASCAAFAINGFVAFVISWRTCFIGHGTFGPLSENGVRWLLAVITVGLFILAVSAGRISYRHWRTISGSRDLAHAESAGTAEFVSMLGVLCSFIMSVGIIWISLPLILIDVCMRAH
jgi:hypothetical protein